MDVPINSVWLSDTVLACTAYPSEPAPDLSSELKSNGFEIEPESELEF